MNAWGRRWLQAFAFVLRLFVDRFFRPDMLTSR
jgi:hypothetical protein